MSGFWNYFAACSSFLSRYQWWPVTEVSFCFHSAWIPFHLVSVFHVVLFPLGIDPFSLFWSLLLNLYLCSSPKCTQEQHLTINVYKHFHILKPWLPIYLSPWNWHPHFFSSAIPPTNPHTCAFFSIMFGGLEDHCNPLMGRAISKWCLSWKLIS